jgi:hypothetical protein
VTRAHANERGPWPALYQLLDAYEKQHAELAAARQDHQAAEADALEMAQIADRLKAELAAARAQIAAMQAVVDASDLLDLPTVTDAIKTANAVPDGCWLTAGPYNVIYMSEARALLAEVERFRALAALSSAEDK